MPAAVGWLENKNKFPRQEQTKKQPVKRVNATVQRLSLRLMDRCSYLGEYVFDHAYSASKLTLVLPSFSAPHFATPRWQRYAAPSVCLCTWWRLLASLSYQVAVAGSGGEQRLRLARDRPMVSPSLTYPSLTFIDATLPITLYFVASFSDRRGIGNGQRTGFALCTFGIPRAEPD